MSEYKQGDGAGAAEPGARDSGAAHDDRSAHSLEVSGYQEPLDEQGDDSPESTATAAPRRRPGEEKKEGRP